MDFVARYRVDPLHRASLKPAHLRGSVLYKMYPVRDGRAVNGATKPDAIEAVTKK
jgi:hypothetical protein